MGHIGCIWLYTAIWLIWLYGCIGYICHIAHIALRRTSWSPAADKGVVSYSTQAEKGFFTYTRARAYARTRACKRHVCGAWSMHVAVCSRTRARMYPW